MSASEGVEFTPDEIDQTMYEPVKTLLTSLVGIGREPRAAIQDLRRLLNRFEDELPPPT